MKNYLKKKLKDSRPFLNIVAFLYNIIYSRSLYFIFNNTIKCKGSFLKKNSFNIQGKNNVIIIGKMARIRYCSFTIIGNNCKIIIGDNNTIVSNTSFHCEDNNSKIIIGNDFTMEGGHIASTEGESIIIGNDCMFSNDIEIRNGDSHSILENSSGKRINWAKKVTINDHVWLTAHVRVLKGSYIPSNTIIANSCIVSNKLDTSFCIYGGSPVRILKENIDWDRDRYKYSLK